MLPGTQHTASVCVCLSVCLSLGMCCPVSLLQAVSAAADEAEEVAFQLSTAPDDLRSEILVSRLTASGAIPTNLLAGAALNLPNRGIVSTCCLGLSCGVVWAGVLGSGCVCWGVHGKEHAGVEGGITPSLELLAASR